MNPEKPRRQADDDQAAAPPKETSKPTPPAGEADSKPVFKIVPANPKNDFDFENVADK